MLEVLARGTRGHSILQEFKGYSKNPQLGNSVKNDCHLLNRNAKTTFSSSLANKG